MFPPQTSISMTPYFSPQEVSHVRHIRSNFHDCGWPTPLHTCHSAQIPVVARQTHQVHRFGTAMNAVIRRSTDTNTIKWFASIAQIIGYGATAMEATPANLYFFVIGILGWFIVGWRWNDRAIMLIHIVALAAMVIGLVAG